jgi:hypothetical protein
MRTSRVFQLMAIYKTFPRFHRDMSLSTIYALLEGVSKVVSDDIWSLEYRRVYIPKGEDK